MTIYLYKKTHNITGLQYLGKTKKDPHKYKGSGDYWTLHIRKYGYDVTTEILKECSTNEEIKHWGLHYSKLWNVVNERDGDGRKTWANLKPETGDGAPSGEYNHMNDPVIKSKHSAAISNHETKQKHKNATKIAMNRADVKNKLRTIRNTKDYKEFIKHKLNSPEIIAGRRGNGNGRYDHTLYKFVHVTGMIEVCTRFELQNKYHLDQGNLSSLISGKIKITKGWRLVKRISDE